MAAQINLQENNIEGTYVIWLDSSVDILEENRIAQQKIRSITGHLKLFENIQDCERYLNQASINDRILLIVSGRLGKEIVPRIHHYRQIFSIYVYCGDKTQHEEWAKHFQKVINYYKHNYFSYYDIKS